MRIAMLSDVETSGGAAIAASRLAAAFVREGHAVNRIVGWPQEGSHPWMTEVLDLQNNFWLRVARRALPERLSQQAISNRLNNRLDEILTRFKPDFINVHNLHSCFPQGWRTDLVRTCTKYAPTVWTLHDMWSFTGRCAYSYDCEKFISGCDERCPTPSEYPALDPEKIQNSWRSRSKFFKSVPDLIAVTPSRWLECEAKRGLWKNHKVHVIPNGLSLNIFKPIDRTAARQTLGIRDTAPVLLFVSHKLSDRRKGAGLFFEALEKLNSRVTLLTMSSEPPPPLQNHRLTHIPLGYVIDDEKKAVVYSAADLFVHSSLADNLPNVILESIACGTPVVAFAVGGVSEIVRQNLTGWLVPQISPDSLCSAIETALRSDLDLRASCRQVAEEELSDEVQAQRYVALRTNPKQR
jgi:glycosyltransferase involved in cell wall biosynthesis